METGTFTDKESPSLPVEIARFVRDAHEIPEDATYLGVFTDEYSPTDASAVYLIGDTLEYVKIPVEPIANN